MSVDRYWVATTAGNWNDTNNWSYYGGGTGGLTLMGTANGLSIKTGGIGIGYPN